MPSQAKERKVCPTCGKDYGTISHLNRHMRNHTGFRPYSCTKCTRTFTRKDHLEDHLRSHTNERPFKCDKCDTRFVNRSHLTRHLELHERPHPHKCEDCGEAFIKKNQLARHRVIHTGRNPFICPEPDCDESFTMPSFLRHHQLRCHTPPSYICTEPGCGVEPFQTYADLRRHMKVHRKAQKFECELCGKRVGSAQSLNNHMQTHELPLVDRLVHKCRFPGCTASFTKASNLNLHVKSRHINREAHVCETCNARFSLKCSLQRHIKNIHGNRTERLTAMHFCRECNEGFAAKSTLRRHMRTAHSLPVHGPDSIEPIDWVISARTGNKRSRRDSTIDHEEVNAMERELMNAELNEAGETSDGDIPENLNPTTMDISRVEIEEQQSNGTDSRRALVGEGTSIKRDPIPDQHNGLIVDPSANTMTTQFIPAMAPPQFRRAKRIRGISDTQSSPNDATPGNFLLRSTDVTLTQPSVAEDLFGAHVSAEGTRMPTSAEPSSRVNRSTLTAQPVSV